MGEILKDEAEYLRRQYVSIYENMRANVRTNFGDMDFANAKERDEMEGLVEEIERLCRNCEAEANGLSFL